MRVLAVVHPPERSGLHTFWGARWRALLDAGVEVHIVLPSELAGFAPDGIPADFVHHAQFRRPRSQRNFAQNLAYLATIRRDAASILRIAERIDGDLLLSHGPHYLTAALASRIAHLPFAVLIHSSAAPAWSARALCAIKKPTVAGYELPSTTAKYAPLFGTTRSVQIAPVLDPRFSADAIQRTPSSAIRVGFVASFSPRKRVDKYLELVERRQVDGLDFRLIGSVASGHIRWWEANIRPRVDRLIRAGSLQLIDGSKGVAPPVSELDFLVITSDDEGIPNVAMEALSVGACVVSLELEGLSALGDLLPKTASRAIRQVERGDGEVDRLIDELRAENLPSREATSNHVLAATAPSHAVMEIAAVFRASLSCQHSS